MKNLDVVVVGSCVIDLLCRPVPLDLPVGGGKLIRTEPLQVTGGGITLNSGVTLARLGLSVAVRTYVGRDDWEPVIRTILRREGIDDSPVETHPTEPSSTTVVLIDPSGERSFLHCVGAPKRLTARAILDRMDLFARSRYMLMGYYSLMPALEPELPEVLRAVRAAGCATALDAAGDGGGMSPLDRLLPHLDVYVPSLSEAAHQTGLSDPRDIIHAYRHCGAPGLLGVKLGRQGVLLSPEAGRFIEVPIVPAPGPVVDTTGAGDCFYAGLLAGLIRGLPVEQAGRLGAAAAACCVTAMGGSTGGRSWAQTAALAGLSAR